MTALHRNLSAGSPAPRHKARVLIVGLDGAPPRLIERLADAGVMPHCARLLREGVFGVLRSTPNYNSFSAWCSFLTGVNPGKHGIFNFLNRTPGTYDLHRVHSRRRRVPSFLNLLSHAGSTVISINVPSTFPAEQLRGLNVADWMTPSVRSQGFTYPPELAPKMLAAIGDYPLHTEVRKPALAGRYDRALRNLLHSFERRLAAAQYCLDRADWDAAAVVFTETDAANHYFSHFDYRHPQHDRRALERHGDLLAQAYAHADAVVGRLLARADDDTTVIILSDHGSCPESRGKAFTRGILEAIGALTPRRAAGSGERLRGMAAAAGKSAFEVANRLLPRGVKMRLDERFRGLSQRMIAGSFIADVEWARTQAYCYYWDTDPCINLRGREPQGIVEPSHYAAVRRWIAERLLAARDARTARPVVKRVIPCEEAYRGPCVEGSPDLIVWWDDRGPIERVRVTGADGSEREVRPSTGLWDVVTGGHHPDGTVIMWGRGIRAGCRLDGASIMDIAPTVLHLLGQPAPAHMDGRVIADALTDDYAAPEVGEARLPGAPEQTVGAASRGDSAGDTGVPLGRGDPDRPQDRDSATAPSDHGYTDDERVAVEQRLRNLGYL